MRGHCVVADKSSGSAVRSRCVLLFKPSGSGRARQSCLLFKSPAVAVRSRCVFAVQVLRQLPCEEVVLYLCWTSPPAEAVRGSRVFCSSLRQWPCEAVVFAEQALRQRLGKAVVPSLNKSSGSGRLRPLLGCLACCCVRRTRQILRQVAV